MLGTITVDHALSQYHFYVVAAIQVPNELCVAVGEHTPDSSFSEPIEETVKTLLAFLTKAALLV